MVERAHLKLTDDFEAVVRDAATAKRITADYLQLARSNLVDQIKADRPQVDAEQWQRLRRLRLACGRASQ